MNNREAYNQWANNYDTVINKTRDVEEEAFSKIIAELPFDAVLEIGCGTGKNTKWLLNKANIIVAADFSEEMLVRAKSKIDDPKVEFLQTDVRKLWPFKDELFDLITFSLVLEHIENIDFIFKEARRVLKPGGYLYIGELHPFKQYAGSKARFDTNGGVFELECFIHNISEYFNTAKKYDFNCIELLEWHNKEKLNNTIPQILTILFKA